MGVSATFEETTISVEPGGQAIVRLRVRNTGTVVDVFTFEAVGIPEGWLVVEPAEVRLFPETEDHVTVTVSPPRSAETPLGDLTFALRVISAEDPTGSIAEELTLQISPFGQRGGELHPHTSTGRAKGSHELAVDNHGNTPISPVIAGVDVNDLLTFEIKPPTVTVQPGSASFVTVSVKPRKRFWRGQPKTLPFQVTVTEGDDEPVVLDGSFVQQPMVPKWLWKLLLALILLLLLLFLLWKTVLEPTIESTARDTVDDLVAEEVSAIDDRLDAAGIPDLGDPPVAPPPGGAPTTTIDVGGGTTTTTTTTPPITVPPTTVPGDITTTTTVPPAPLEVGGPVDFVMQLVDQPLGDAAAVAQIVPAGSRLDLTDIIFQNPTGAIGEIRVQRNSDPLFRLQLANFRDLDYHFVAPIVFDDTDVIQVVFICVTPGQILPKTTEGCEAQVVFAGFLEPVAP